MKVYYTFLKNLNICLKNPDYSTLAILINENA